MKKFILGFVVAAILFSIFPVGAAITEYVCYKADYKVIINGNEYSHPDLPILNYKGSTYAPFRSVLETAGLKVEWDNELRQASVTTPKSINNERKEETVDNNNIEVEIVQFENADVPKGKWSFSTYDPKVERRIENYFFETNDVVLYNGDVHINLAIFNRTSDNIVEESGQEDSIWYVVLSYKNSSHKYFTNQINDIIYPTYLSGNRGSYLNINHMPCLMELDNFKAVMNLIN